MSKKPKIAVLQFPGTNCELESVAALTRTGFDADIIRWNKKGELKKFDGVVLPGGFSYEDRGRSGLIAGRAKILEEVHALAKQGKPVLGICNGAQILVESGLVPNFELGKSTLALTRNRRVDVAGKVLGTGFYNAWACIRSGAKLGVNAFNNFDEDVVIRLPVAHGEGRFFTPDANLLSALIENQQTAFIYCNAEGEVIPEFPVNPNGSVLNLAGVTNSSGNVLALMPHPERTLKGDKIFKSMYKWITGEGRGTSLRRAQSNRDEGRVKKSGILISKHETNSKFEILNSKLPKFDVEFFVSLKITDNEALTVESAVQDFGIKLRLKKYRWFGLKVPNTKYEILNTFEKIIRSGDLLNPEKEDVVVKIGAQFFRFEKKRGLTPTRFELPKLKILVTERETSLDDARRAGLNHTLGSQQIQSLQSGVVWAAETGSQKDFAKAVAGNFFHHSAAMEVISF